MIDISLLKELNQPGHECRLNALEFVAEKTRFPEPLRWCINNHIHTNFSFSPYSPTAAAYYARVSGLSSAGIVDHDSVGGAREFVKAGMILNMPTTVGVELRASMVGSEFENRRTNHPDQLGISYCALHGVPITAIDTVDAFLAPLRKIRNKRVELMTDRLNDIMEDIHISFEADILPLSLYKEGGCITERHLLLAFARALIKHFGRGLSLITKLTKLGVDMDNKQCKLLSDTDYYFYDYDLLGVLKSAFLDQIYLSATDECPNLSDLIAFADKIGAVLCYAYLGDVLESVTGDKKAQKFEDDYLEELFFFLKNKGINAITYMLTRNTDLQLKTVKSLCKKYDMLEICGEDINSPRQSFVCNKLRLSEYSNLIETTKILIAKSKGGLIS